MSRNSRTALLLLFVLFLGTFARPAAAQPAREPESPALGRRLVEIWRTLASPVVNLWNAADGRGIWDPNGGAATQAAPIDPGSGDGRGIWDPNGS